MTLEQLKQQDKRYAQKIAEYLISRCEEDENLNNKILTTPKTLKGCVEYCKQEAKKQAEDGVAVIVDEEVFGWCVDYFLNEKLNCEPKPKSNKKSKGKSKDDEEDDTDLDELGEEEEEKPKSKPKKQAPKETEKKEKTVEEAMVQQLSIFDL